MKKLKLLLVAAMMVGLWSGSASAIIVDAEFSITGDQANGYGNSVQGLTLANNTVAVQDWIGITVANPLPSGASVEFTASGGQTSIATPSLNLRLWNAVDNGAGDWSTVGPAIITQIPAGALTPMMGGLMAGSTYLMEFFGDVIYLACGVCGDTQTGLYSMSMDSNNVPVPAAIWLFGTAVVGFVGLRRKQKFSAVAA